MAQCYRCGAEVEITDRFCMECSAENPAGPPPGGAGAAALPMGVPNLAPPARTAPTWLPPEDTPLPPMQQPVAPALQEESNGLLRSTLSATDSINCPRCGARLPKNARFCGDCGERLGSPTSNRPGSSSLMTIISPPPPVAEAAPWSPAALPDPIAPPLFTSTAAPEASASPVLPPFRASSWAAQPVPDVGMPDSTWMPPPSGVPADSAAGMPAWNQGAPAAPWSPATPAAGIMPPPGPGWAPAPPQGASNAGSFAPPAMLPGGGGAGPAVSAFLQGISSPPPSTTRQRTYPRGQVIAMIVAAIVTVVAATAGVIVQFVLK